MKIEIRIFMNPEFVFEIPLDIPSWHKRYHSGTICKGVSNSQTSHTFLMHYLSVRQRGR